MKNFKEILLLTTLAALVTSCGNSEVGVTKNVTVPGDTPDPVTIYTSNVSKAPIVLSGSDIKIGTTTTIRDIKPPVGAARLKIYRNDGKTELLDYDLTGFDQDTGFQLNVPVDLQGITSNLLISSIDSEGVESSKIDYILTHKSEYIVKLTDFRDISGSNTSTCAITNLNRVKCWGNNQFGDLGIGNTDNGYINVNESSGFMNMGALTPVKIQAEYNIKCILYSDATLRCFGRNTSGVLGQESSASSIGGSPGEEGTNIPAIPLGADVIDFSTNNNQTCAILTGGILKCWGQNGQGQLGQESTTDIGANTGDISSLPAINLGTGRTAKKVKAGSDKVCAILDNDSLKCWGNNNQGVLGTESSLDVGHNSNSMGDNLAPIDLGTGRTVKKLFMESQNICVILDNDQLKCWGSGFNGQLGTGSMMSVGANVGDMGDNLAPIDLGTGRTVVDLVMADGYFCALLDNDQIKCWGKNTQGGLGIGTTENMGDDPGEMGDNLPAVDLGTNNGNVVSIEALYNQVCVLFDTNKVKCFGANINSPAVYFGDDSSDMGDNLPHLNFFGESFKPIKMTKVSRQTVCLNDENGNYKCFGRNVGGVAGYPDNIPRGFITSDDSSPYLLKSLDLGL